MLKGFDSMHPYNLTLKLMNQFDYQETIAVIKSENWYVPTVVSESFAAQLVIGEKLPYPSAWVHYMTDYAAEQRFLNSKELYALLRTDPHFTNIMPDEYSRGMRKWVLTVVNSFTGGELE